MRILGMKLLNHDCNVCEVEDHEIKYALEFERVSKQRYHYENFFNNSERLDYWLDFLRDYRQDKKPVDVVVLDIITYGQRFYNRIIRREGSLLKRIKAGLIDRGIASKKVIFRSCKHHEGHAYGCFYTSPYNEALILSYDGAGDDGFTNLYFGSSKGIKLVRKYPYWLGRIYKSQKDFFTDLRYDKKKGGEESVAGKLMAVASYGKRRKEWDKVILSYIKGFHKLTSRVLDDPDYHRKVADVPEEIKAGISVESKLAHDWMFNFQYWWTRLIRDILRENLSNYNTVNLCIAGGCALNCVTNNHLLKELDLKTIYVPPNPNDCGLGLGFAYSYVYGKLKINKRLKYPVNPYYNCRILDKPVCPDGVKKKAANLEQVAGYLHQGFIIGFIHGDSEMGPRALGNRSIICDPSKDGMRDILNKKVKHREWFRPFAPIVRVEDASQYFEFQIESPYMSFAVDVRPEYQDDLKEIVHVDGTARLQTLRRETNPLMWDLLRLYKEKYEIGVLLNTSFNIKGRPIMTTYEDAFLVLTETKLDAVFDGENIYFQNGADLSKSVHCEMS